MAKFRCVVVGAGGISRAWFPPLVQEKVEIAGIVDLNQEAAQAKADQYELDCLISDDLSGALKETEPDFVVDLTTPEAHCAVTCTALKAGCHVIGEKPMAASMAEARKMVRTAEQADRLYMVSQSRRWVAHHETIRRAIAGGKLGTLNTVNCEFYIGARFGGFRAEMDSPLILDMSIHHFDLVRQMTGKDPVAVYAHEYDPDGSWYRGDVAAACIFEMDDGVVFSYMGSWCAEGCNTSWHGDWRFVGSKGSMLYRADKPPVAERPVKGSGLIWPTKKMSLPPASVRHESMRGALREMLAYLRTGKTPQTECHDNIKSLAMVFAAMESSRKGRRVPVKGLD